MHSFFRRRSPSRSPSRLPTHTHRPRPRRTRTDGPAHILRKLSDGALGCLEGVKPVALAVKAYMQNWTVNRVKGVVMVVCPVVTAVLAHLAQEDWEKKGAEERKGKTLASTLGTDTDAGDDYSYSNTRDATTMQGQNTINEQTFGPENVSSEKPEFITIPIPTL